MWRKMMQSIKYNTEEERIQAGHERNRVHSDIGRRVGDIAKVHSKISERKSLTEQELALTLDVLQMAVCDVLHEDAETEFLLRQLREKG
jgi:hypothetical protein